MFLKVRDEVPGPRSLSFSENVAARLPRSLPCAGLCLSGHELCLCLCALAAPAASLPGLFGLHTVLVLLLSATFGLCSRFGYYAQNGCQHLHTNIPCGITLRSGPPLPGVVEYIRPPEAVRAWAAHTSVTLGLVRASMATLLVLLGPGLHP